MRVAILSTMEPAADGAQAPRAFLWIGGQTLARQQLALVMALGCERVICLARGVARELIELQHDAERAGVQFHIVNGPHALLGLVTVADEVIVLAEGLFVTVDAAALLEKGQCVLVQPIERGLAAGFERIDLNSASAGAMRLPGRLIERLAELPIDCDTISALQRIALQAGVAQRPLPALADGAGFWTLVRSEIEAHAIEPHWIRQRIRIEGPVTPGNWIALRGVRAFGPALLHAGSGPRVISTAAVILGILALAAGWFGALPLAFGLAGSGWIGRRAAIALRRIHGDGLAGGGSSRTIDTILGWLGDSVFVILGGIASTGHFQQPIWERLFPSLILVALLRLVPRATGGRWTALLHDRALLALGLGLAAAAGMADVVIHGTAALLALAGILVPRGDTGLTRT